jgi:uncharacterized oxidoreductase
MGALPERMLSADTLHGFAASLLRSAGAAADEAEIVAASLVDANLCGHDSHGVLRIPEYVGQIRAGELVPGARFEKVRETACVLVADAQFGFGQIQCARMIDQLVPKAQSQGTASGTLRNCGHVGRLGEWAARIAARGLAGLVAVNDNGVLKCVAPPGGVEPCISTNPLAIGVPFSNGSDLVFDMSTSAVANGKIRMNQLAGRPCPEGWLQDADGNPTVIASTRFADPPATILPLGGDQSYKGFGLGLLLDILTAGLAGGFCPPAPAGTRAANNVLFVLWNPELFAGGEHFVNEATKLADFVRASRRKPGVEAIRLPGDRSSALRSRRQNEGIPIDAGTWKSLADLAREFGIDLPITIEDQA